MELVELFETARPRLTSLAYRIVGSHHDAEDAVQTAWLRVQSADQGDIANPDGWFTTVTARLCLDQLRARDRHRELPLSDELPGEQLGADEAYLRREDVSRALLVLLDELTPRQRVAYVLHDLFAVPFDQVAAVLDTNPTSAKKLASRARGRLHDAPPAEPDRTDEHFAVIEAFLSAARGGDLARLITLLAPDAVRTVDPRLLPPGAPTTVRGASNVAEATRGFVDRIAAAAPVLLAGHPGALIAPGGHPYALVHFHIDAGVVTRIDVTPYTRGAVQLAGATR